MLEQDIIYNDELNPNKPETERQDSARITPRRPRPAPFSKEAKLAEQRKAEAETRRKAREEANLQRQQKTAERERFRKAMAKARAGDKNGQRKLGRESHILLERVQQLMRG